MYRVELKHLRPAYRKGDLEEELVIESVKEFRTKKLAKEYVLSKVSGEVYRASWRNNPEPSRVSYYTGKTWINENSGEKREEQYIYIITKI